MEPGEALAAEHAMAGGVSESQYRSCAQGQVDRSDQQALTSGQAKEEGVGLGQGQEQEGGQRQGGVEGQEEEGEVRPLSRMKKVATKHKLQVSSDDDEE